MKDLKISLAKSYLTLLASRAKGNIQKQIDNCYTQFLYLEDNRRKMIDMINAKNDLLIYRERKEQELNSEISRLKMELQEKDKQILVKDKQIEDLKTDIEKDFLEVLNSWRLK